MNKPTDDLLPTRRFSSRVENYVKYRPDYPDAVVTLLETEVGLSSSSPIADVGSGTGILTALLLQHGVTVYAVEPNDDMRMAAEQLLGGNPRFHSVAGTSESTGLPDDSVDGVTVAQAFHWFDQQKAVAEFKRITKPGGFVALIWNARMIDRSPFMREYERIVRTYGSEFTRLDKELVPLDTLRQLFGPSMALHVFPNYQELDWEGLRGRLLSASYMPLAGQDGFEPMLTELRTAFDRHQSDGRVRLEYDTQVYLVRLES
jgi:SAM-dependent methyltransferase